MDPRKVIPDGRAFGVNEVKTDIDYKSKDYDLECYSGGEITKTGRLDIAALKPKRESLPEFVFRWDEKTESLDVDILNVSENAKRKFRQEVEGYRGHHTRRIPDCKDRRVYETLIEMPLFGTVFRGRIVAPLHRKLELSSSIGFKAHLESVIKKQKS